MGGNDSTSHYSTIGPSVLVMLLAVSTVWYSVSLNLMGLHHANDTGRLPSPARHRHFKSDTARRFCFIKDHLKS